MVDSITTTAQPPVAAALSRDELGAVAVRAHHLTKVYGTGAAAVTALDDVSVEFFAREFTTIMGPSGSGKSTLMHLLAGLDSATAGQAWIGGTEVTTLGDKQLTKLRRDRIGFVFQQFNLLPMLTAAQNITLPVELGGGRVDQAWFDQLVGTLEIGDRLGHRPAEMSGGQQQRVAIARALINKPDVVFADEPTGNLDARSGAQVLEFLRRSVTSLGSTIIMVTHDPAAASYADRVLLLADGRVAGDLAEPTHEQIMAGLDAVSRVSGTTTTAAVVSSDALRPERSSGDSKCPGGSATASTAHNGGSATVSTTGSEYGAAVSGTTTARPEGVADV